MKKLADLSIHDKQLYVLFRVLDVLLLDDAGENDASAGEMNRRCRLLMECACNECGIEIPDLEKYTHGSGDYDSNDVRTFYARMVMDSYGLTDADMQRLASRDPYPWE